MKNRRYKLIFPPGLNAVNPTFPFGFYTGLPLVVADDSEQDEEDLR